MAAPGVLAPSRGGPAGPSPPPPPGGRAGLFRDALDPLDLPRLRRLCAGGVPDAPASLRARTWKSLLGLRPTGGGGGDPAAHCAAKRAQYADYCREFVRESPGRAAAADAPPDLPPPPARNGPLRGVPARDHPLETSGGSVWAAHFGDNEVREQIDRDVMRTHPDMHFFSGDGPDARRHRASLRRALFVYAKLNPGLRYVQGMNEVYAPLYWAFCKDEAPDEARHAEADAFFCFVELMSEFRDYFCKQLDSSEVGVKALLAALARRLHEADRELSNHLVLGLRIDAQIYAFRWITLLLTQEFLFPDLVRLWDTLLSDPAGRTDCLLRLCLAMLTHVRAELLAGDFAACVKLLQRYPPGTDVGDLLRRAEALRGAGG